MNDEVLQSLLLPIGEAAPTGEDLEYDADFMALERAAAPRAERAVGESVKAAEEPDWDRVQTLAEALLARSKDLRVAVHLSTAWMRMQGLPGWARGLTLIRGLLEQYWDGIHPQLDADDDGDPTARINAIVPLGDFLSVLGYFRTTPFVQSQRLGRFSLRDLRIAIGTLKVSDAESSEGLATMADIEACCMDCVEADLTATLDAVGLILEHTKAIDAIFNEHVGNAGPDLKALLSDSYELKKFIASQAAARSPVENTSDDDSRESSGEPAGEAIGNVVAANGRIQTADDVRRRLDELCDYYARAEPSSPLPLLLRRAQRLVGLSFVDLMKDLAPGGMGELQVVSGSEES